MLSVAVGLELDFSHLRAKGIDTLLTRMRQKRLIEVPTLYLPRLMRLLAPFAPRFSKHVSGNTSRLFLGDFLRVVRAHQHGESLKGLRRTPNLCGVLRSLMAKVEQKSGS